MILSFADCLIDTRQHRFERAGEVQHIEPQVFDLLLLLSQRPGELISRDELIATVWKGQIVSESTISARISAARQVVGDDGKAQRIIKTIPRRGVQLVVPVETEGAEKPRQTDQDSHRPDIRFATSADGTSIAYTISGEGPPLLRGGHWLTHLEFDRRSNIWQPFLSALESRFRLVRYDQRGTGLSERDVEFSGVEGFAADMCAVADSAGLDRFPIFATSQAAPVAIRFAVSHPERVSRMVILGGYAEGRAFRTRGEGEVDEETLGALLRSGWGIHGSTFAKSFANLFAPTANSDQLFELVELQKQSVDAKQALALRKAIDRFNIVDLLPMVRCPVLVIHATGDVVHPLSQGRLLASELPDARFVMLDSAGHIQLEQDPSWQVMLNETFRFLAEEEIIP